jgi:hypothetical protein
VNIIEGWFELTELWIEAVEHFWDEWLDLVWWPPLDALAEMLVALSEVDVEAP